MKGLFADSAAVLQIYVADSPSTFSSLVRLSITFSAEAPTVRLYYPLSLDEGTPDVTSPITYSGLEFECDERGAHLTLEHTSDATVFRVMRRRWARGEVDVRIHLDLDAAFVQRIGSEFEPNGN